MCSLSSLVVPLVAGFTHPKWCRLLSTIYPLDYIRIYIRYLLAQMVKQMYHDMGKSLVYVLEAKPFWQPAS